jgi:hypothetical protein
VLRPFKATPTTGTATENRGKGKAPQIGRDSGGSSSGTAGTGGATAGHVAPLRAPATNPWTIMVHAWPMPWRPHALRAGVLGPCPGAPLPFAGHVAHHQPAPQHYQPVPPLYQAPPHPAPAKYGGAAWDQSALVQALNNMIMSVQRNHVPPSNSEWYYLDTDTSSHMSNSSRMLSDLTPSHSRIVVGNGSSLPVSHSGHLAIPTTSRSILLRNILVSPLLIKNLISVKTLC